MLSAKMRLALLIIFISALTVKAASIKKSMSESTLKPEIPTKPSKTKTSPSVTKSKIPALVAIEIVDGPETNSSAPKNTSKRTIESALGYGYNPSVFGPEQQKKFVIYKYSQHDIPPLSYNQFGGGGGGGGGYGGQSSSIQKGLGYHVSSTATHVEHQPSVELKSSPQPIYQAPLEHSTTQNHDNPDTTTLYTTLTHQGQVGGLSNHVPYQNVGHDGMVPVIILRIYSNQLTSPDTALHTNLPQSHPYSILNNINLQSLLQNYVHQYLQSQPQHYQTQDYQQVYQGHGQVYQPAYAMPNEYHSNLPTSENYPSNSHTRVIFHSNNNGHIPVPPSMYKTPGLSTYKTVASLPTYNVPQVNYADSDYAYSDGQNLEQNYMYVYPNQDVGYQQEDKAEESQEPDLSNPPYNYHAHPSELARKQRSKKSSIEISSTLPPKRREPRT